MSHYKTFIVKELGSLVVIFLARVFLFGSFNFGLFDYYYITSTASSIFNYAPPIVKVVNVELLPPLPNHKYKIACSNETVEGLKKSITKRLKGINKNSIVIIHDGYELLENKKLSDLFKENEVNLSVQSIGSKGNYIKAPEPASSNLMIQ